MFPQHFFEILTGFTVTDGKQTSIKVRKCTFLLPVLPSVFTEYNFEDNFENKLSLKV